MLDGRAGLVQRVGAVNRLWQRAVADLTLEHVNHAERRGVLPIAFTLFHSVGGQDRSATNFAGAGPMLWDPDGWSTRTGVKMGLIGRGTPMDVAERVRIGDIDAWRAYQTAVFAKTERALATITDDQLSKAAFDARPDVATSFLGVLVPSGIPRVIDVVEAYIYQHAARHLGELEHARALVGLGGVS